jgi:hypothetical protein
MRRLDGVSELVGQLVEVLAENGVVAFDEWVATVLVILLQILNSFFEVV